MLVVLNIPASKVHTQAIAGHAAESAASGEYDIAFAPLGEIMAVRGALVLGLFPPEFQNTLGISSGLAAKAVHPEAATALARFLITPASMKIMLVSGLSPLPR